MRTLKAKTVVAWSIKQNQNKHLKLAKNQKIIVECFENWTINIQSNKKPPNLDKFLDFCNY